MAVLAVATDRDAVPRIRVTEQPMEYLIELDVSGFTEDELALETFGHRLTVIGDREPRGDLDGGPHVALRLEESFRLPDRRRRRSGRGVPRGRIARDSRAPTTSSEPSCGDRAEVPR